MNNPLSAVTESGLNKLLRIARHQRWSNQFSFSGIKNINNLFGSSSEIASYRPYVQGEDVRNIDWRQSARRQRPQIREHHTLHSAEWYVCLDISSSMAQPTLEKWERSIQLTAAVIYLLLGMNNKAGVIIFDESVKFIAKPDSNNLHYHNIYNHLASLSPPKPGRGTNLISCLPFIGRRNPIVIISDLYAENRISSDLLHLKKNRSNIHIIQVTNKITEFKSNSKIIKLVDSESGDTTTIANSQDNISLSNKKQQNYNANICHFCNSNKILLTQIEASQDWFTAVLCHLRNNIN